MNNYRPSTYVAWRFISIVAIVAIVIVIFVVHPYWRAEIQDLFVQAQKNALLIGLGIFAAVVLLLIFWPRPVSGRRMKRSMYQEVPYGYPSPYDSYPVRSSGLWPVLILLALLALGWYFWPFLSHTFPLVNQLLPHTASVSTPSTTPYDSVVGDPDLTPSFVDKVLASVVSPATGLGTTLYTLSIQYHIKTSFALAVFHHESNYGLVGVARTTKSWGNIICIGWSRCVDGFRAYASWADGAADFYKLIYTQYIARGRSTLTTIFPVYSPKPQNNPTSYIQDIQADVSHWEQGQV